MEFDDICVCFDIIPECDGQTNGFTLTILRSARIGMLTHDKNYKRGLRVTFFKHPVYAISGSVVSGHC